MDTSYLAPDNLSILVFFPRTSVLKKLQDYKAPESRVSFEWTSPISESWPPIMMSLSDRCTTAAPASIWPDNPMWGTAQVRCTAVCSWQPNLKHHFSYLKKTLTIFYMEYDALPSSKPENGVEVHPRGTGLLHWWLSKFQDQKLLA